MIGARRTRWMHAAGALSATALVLVSPVLTRAAGMGGELQVSSDGSRWASSYAGPLIAGGEPLAPGSVRSGSVYVRNSTAGDATLSLSTADVTDAVGVLLDVTLLDGDRVVDSTTRSLSDLAHAPDLGLGEVLEGRGIRRLEVGLRLDDAAGNESQQQTIAFTIVVSLQGEAVEVPGTPRPGLPTQPGPLPRTGADDDAFLIAAVAVVGAGISLRVLSRHRR